MDDRNGDRMDHFNISDKNPSVMRQDLCMHFLSFI